MTIYLTKYTGDNRNIDKWDFNSAPQNAKRTVDVYNTTSLLAPQVVLDYSDDIINNDYNYCYINKYHRYYYITDMAADNGKRIILTLAVDPLNTWKNEIKNCPVNVIRSQSAGITYCKDDRLPVNPSQFTLYSAPLKEGVFPRSAQRQAHYILSVNTAISEG